MNQPALFAEPETMRSPICVYRPHCGARVVLAEPEDCGSCINRELRCLRCGRTGVLSTRKEQA